MSIVLLLKIYITSQINILINFLQKVPLIGRIIPESLYRKYDIKGAISICGLIFDILKSIIMRSILILLFVRYMTYVVLSREAYTDFRLMFIFVSVFVIYPFLGGSNILAANTEDQMFIHYFMVNPGLYYKYKAMKGVILGGVSVIPVLIYIYKDIVMAGTMALLYIAGMVATDVIYLHYFKNKHALPRRSVRRILGLLIIAIAYFACGLGIVPNLEITQTGYMTIGCVCIVITVFGTIYVLKYNEYRELAIKYADKSLIKFAISSGNSYDAETLKVLDRGCQYNKDYFEKNKDLPSEVYIDKAYRIRYRKAIWEPILTNTVSYSVILALIGISVRLGWINLTAETLLTYSPILVSIAMSASLVSASSQRYFRNIDYIYIKSRMITKDFLKRLMLARYFRTIIIDLIISLTILIESALFLVTSGIKIPLNEYAWLMASIVPILIIYDTYEWLLYYLIQPYSVDLTAKSPIFNVMRQLESVLMILLLFIRANMSRLSIPIIGITVFAMGAFYISSNYAYKTFKIRT